MALGLQLDSDDPRRARVLSEEGIDLDVARPRVKSAAIRRPVQGRVQIARSGDIC